LEKGYGITNPENDFVVASIKHWEKNPGDRIEVGDALAVVEADKVTAEMLSSWSGKISNILYAEGESWELGVTKDGKELEARREDTPFGQILLPELGWIETDETIEIKETTENKEISEIPETEKIRVRAAPAARKLAHEHGIDITTVQGSGLGGRVMRMDVEQAISTQRAEPLPYEAPLRKQADLPKDEDPLLVTAVDRTPLNATIIRKTIAYYMQKSYAEIPKAGDAITVDVTNLRSFYRERRELWREDTGTDFSFTGLFMFLAVRLLFDQREKFGIVNAYWDKDKNDAYLFNHVNIGMAVQTPEGLMVPVIHDAEKLCLRELMAAVDDRVQRALSQKIILSELRDLTFTVNNVGAMGGENPDSIVPYTKESSGKERPTGMILVLGAIKQFPNDKFISELARLGIIKEKNDFDARYYMTLAFSFDHRLFDGVPALEFVNALKQYIESKESSDGFRELFDPKFKF